MSCDVPFSTTQYSDVHRKQHVIEGPTFAVMCNDLGPLLFEHKSNGTL